jgi:hypothetical protein
MADREPGNVGDEIARHATSLGIDHAAPDAASEALTLTECAFSPIRSG